MIVRFWARASASHGAALSGMAISSITYIHGLVGAAVQRPLERADPRR